jgi:hypothetical protein
VQLVFTASVEPHVFAEMANGPLMLNGFSPATSLPVFATVMYCTGLVCPMRTDPNWLLRTKSLLVTLGAPNVNATPPVLRIVRLSAPLAVPTACEAKFNVAGPIVAVAVVDFSAWLASTACHTPRPFVPTRSHFSPLVSTALSVVTRTAGNPVP